jgi:hypothetical protein
MCVVGGGKRMASGPRLSVIGWWDLEDWEITSLLDYLSEISSFLFLQRVKFSDLAKKIKRLLELL